MSKLNASADPFVPRSVQAAQAYACAMEEERSLFMTFSNGFPLTWQEISDHFTREYGHECVEYVYVHKQRHPMFGRIIFTTSEWPRMILGTNKMVRISVNNKPVWLKKYVSRSRRMQ